jgi:hypothetical protein
MDDINAACMCPNARCKLRGNCKMCKESHRGKTFCASPRWLQNIMRVVMPKEKR